jgi:alanyl-tRNA synthetase
MMAQSLGSSKEKLVQSFQKSIDEAEAAKKRVKTIIRKISPSIVKSISNESKQLGKGIKFYHVYDEELDDEYHISIGEKSIESDPSLIYLALILKGEGIRVVVFVGETAQKKIKAFSIAKQLSVQLGGSGGGDDRFGQGGGKFKEKISSALLSVEELLLNSNM